MKIIRFKNKYEMQRETIDDLCPYPLLGGAYGFEQTKLNINAFNYLPEKPSC